MKRIIVVTTLVLMAGLVGWTPASAATCPPASLGGPAVGYVKAGKAKVALKSITYKRGGALDPPATNKVAGISKRSAKIGAKRGTTIITWHVRYGYGCNGKLNTVLKMPIGSTFTAQKLGKEPITYRIVKKVTVPKGKHKRSWFTLAGKPRLILLTCADLTGGKFISTTAVIAVPVPPAPVTPPPSEQAAPPTT